MNIYKEALKLMITAETEDPASKIDLDELEQTIANLPGDFSIDESIDESALELSKPERDDIKNAVEVLKPPKSPEKIKRRQGISRKIINQLHKLLHGKLTKKQQEELKRLKQYEELSGKTEDPKQTTQQAQEASTKEILPETTRVPTVPKEKIDFLKETTNIRDKRHEMHKKQLENLVTPTEDDANDIVSSISGSTLQLLNSWREKEGLPPLEMPPTSSTEVSGTFVKDNTVTESISNYLKYYATSKNISQYSDSLLNPLLFYAILNGINEEKGYKFAEYIYRLAFGEGKKIGTRAYIAKDFCGWTLNELKMILDTISKTVNEYIEANNIVEEKLSPERISYLLQRGGGYIEKLINASFSKENLDYFSKLIEDQLATSIKKSQDQLAVDKFFKSLSNTKKLEIIVGAMLSSSDTFPANTREAFALKHLYNSVTNLQEGLTRETGIQTRPSTYKESLELLQNQEIEVGKTKDIIEERGLTGVEFKSDSINEEDQNIENFKVFPEPNKIFTVVTNFPDFYTKNNIKSAIQSLKLASERLYHPETFNAWEEMVVSIGKKIVGEKKAEEELKKWLEESGKTISEHAKKTFKVRIEKEYKNKKFEKVQIFDKNGNEIELSDEDKEKNIFPAQVIAAAEKYLSQDELYNLACSFKIISDESVEKIRDPYRALKYGVREPQLLTPYHQNIITAFKNQALSLYKKAIFEVLNY